VQHAQPEQLGLELAEQPGMRATAADPQRRIVAYSVAQVWQEQRRAGRRADDPDRGVVPVLEPAMVGNSVMPVRTTVFARAMDWLPAREARRRGRAEHPPVPAILAVMFLVTVILIWSVPDDDIQE